MQSFAMLVRHVSGAKNTVADWLSRMHGYLTSERALDQMSEVHAEISCLLDCMLDDPEECSSTVDSSLADVVDVLAGAAKADAKVWTAEEMFNEVHGGRKLHFGARRTWLALNRRFPGHKISFKWIAERIEKCALCQKDRLGMDNYLEPIYRHIKPSYPRKAVGVDRLTVTPADEQGNTCLIVVVVFFTKYVWATPAKEYNATTAASALFTFFCTFGKFDEL